METQQLASETPWYVLRAETGRELFVSDQLTLREIEAFAPARQETKFWSHRPAQVRRKALFPGYVFARFPVERRTDALQVPGIIDVLAFGRVAATVEDAKIASIRQMSDSGVAESVGLAAGQYVTVRVGRFAGIRGVLAEIKNALRVVVNVDLLGRGIGVEVDSCAVSA